MELFWLYLELQECKMEQEADLQDRVSIVQSDFIQELCNREKGKGIHLTFRGLMLYYCPCWDGISCP